MGYLNLLFGDFLLKHHSFRDPFKVELSESDSGASGEGKLIRILMNDFKLDRDEISELYRKRWQIELFYKWMKQHLYQGMLLRQQDRLKLKIVRLCDLIEKPPRVSEA